MALLAATLCSWHTGAPLITNLKGRTSLLRCDYGDFFYDGHWEPLPEGVYEVRISRPLGLGFEEDGPIIGKSGVSVNTIVEDSNAARSTVEVGDKLVGVTGIKYVGSKWERQMFDCSKWAFDTVVDAIGSNSEKFDCKNDEVILQFKNPSS